MKKVVFIGSHLGYPMDRTPLGGGAMVALELARHWPVKAGFEAVLLGSGPVPPRDGVEYVRLAAEKRPLESLSELEYAAFCRRFEAQTTRWLLERRERFSPAETTVLVNDISEGPDLAALSRAGYPIVSLWHVDVVDYFNKLYLKKLIPVERVAALYEKARGAKRLIPDVLKLVFEKQRDTVVYSRKMIFPSRGMARTVDRCYGGLVKGGIASRALVVPWGMWDAGGREEDAEQEAKELRDHFQIGPDTAVLMTLSRVSPEKGLHLLLKAARLLEQRRDLEGRDICLFMCGEPAFMQGQAYWAKVKAEAARLKHIRVFFPGYLPASRKRAYLSLATLFISPSIHESYGLNIVEAMQAGRAILASDHYGVQDLLTEDFGRVVPYGTLAQVPRRLCEALAELLEQPERLKRMGRAARKAAEGMPFARAAQKVLDAALEAQQ